jgi:hypothetical protein
VKAIFFAGVSTILVLPAFIVCFFVKIGVTGQHVVMLSEFREFRENWPKEGHSFLTGVKEAALPTVP